MDILKNWKYVGGKGVYKYEDREDNDAILSRLISGLLSANLKIIVVAKTKMVEYYSKKFSYPVHSADQVTMDKRIVDVLIIIDAGDIADNVINLVLMRIVFKYMFATVSKFNYDNDLDKFPRLTSDAIKSKRSIDSKHNEIHLSIELSNNEFAKYEEITNKMKDIFEMFNGDFDTIVKCYRGDMQSGITADNFRREFAKASGWNENLDVSIQYYKDLSEGFNPNAIYEKAKMYHDLIAMRNHYLDEHFVKILTVNSIVSYLKTRRFVIVCKNSKMADDISNFLNKKGDICNAIHNDHKNVYLSDDDGNLILYKSGAKKGQPKGHGSKTVNSTYIRAFNNHDIRCICITNSLVKDTSIEDIDGLIYTSPKCLSYLELNKRSKLIFNSNVNIINLSLLNTKDDDNYNDRYKAYNTFVKKFDKDDIDKLKIY